MFSGSTGSAVTVTFLHNSSISAEYAYMYSKG